MSYDVLKKSMFYATVPTQWVDNGDKVLVRLEWTASVDVDFFIDEPGVGTYSYRGVPAAGAGTFTNDLSCRNGNQFCEEGVTSVESVWWPLREVSEEDIVLKVYNHSGTDAPIPAKIFISKTGERTKEFDVTIPAERRSMTEIMRVNLSD